MKKQREKTEADVAKEMAHKFQNDMYPVLNFRSIDEVRDDFQNHYEHLHTLMTAHKRHTKLYEKSENRSNKMFDKIKALWSKGFSYLKGLSWKN